MSGKPRKTPIKPTSIEPRPDDFTPILTLITAARTRALTAVNTALIDLYWAIGEYISQKISEDGWGEATVKELAQYIQKH